MKNSYCTRGFHTFFAVDSYINLGVDWAVGGRVLTLQISQFRNKMLLTSEIRFWMNKAAAEKRVSQSWAQSQRISGAMKRSEQGCSKLRKGAIMYTQVCITRFVKGMRTKAQGKRIS